ncbi:MAG TPA: alpha-glucosidase C-terminal domain-containing protein, partial [Chitinophagales bacterium]|nr:alpha-glucosidase C-terminal domain-containing protein [Chitinophagales bacterium]
ALHSGKIEIVHTGNKNILAFVRSFEEEKLVVLINFCNSKVTVNINLPIKEMVFSIGQKNGFNGVLKGFSGIIVKL